MEEAWLPFSRAPSTRDQHVGPDLFLSLEGYVQARYSWKQKHAANSLILVPKKRLRVVVLATLAEFCWQFKKKHNEVLE